MQHPEQPAARGERGVIASQISRDIVHLHAKLYGRGPTRARTYLHDDYALCVLQDVFTAAERTLIEADRSEHVVASRLAFQDAVKDQFVALAEEATGRQVQAFISQISIEAELAVALFLFVRQPAEETSARGDGTGV